jgi:mannose-6-phosphate isomerase-like protein (cupin superfamily)
MMPDRVTEEQSGQTLPELLPKVFTQVQRGRVCNPHEGRTVTIGELLVTVKTDGAETDGRFALVEITVPPYFNDIAPHLHHHTCEAIYLTQGMLAVTLGEETMVVRQGSFILVPPYQTHRIWNPTATQATFLLYFAPAGAEAFFEAVAAQVAQSSSPPATSPFAPNNALAEVWQLGAEYDHFVMFK